MTNTTAPSFVFPYPEIVLDFSTLKGCARSILQTEVQSKLMEAGFRFSSSVDRSPKHTDCAHLRVNAKDISDPRHLQVDNLPFVVAVGNSVILRAETQSEEFLKLAEEFKRGTIAKAAEAITKVVTDLLVDVLTKELANSSKPNPPKS